MAEDNVKDRLGFHFSGRTHHPGTFWYPVRGRPCMRRTGDSLDGENHRETARTSTGFCAKDCRVGYWSCSKPGCIPAAFRVHATTHWSQDRRAIENAISVYRCHLKCTTRAWSMRRGMTVISTAAMALSTVLRSVRAVCKGPELTNIRPCILIYIRASRHLHPTKPGDAQLASCTSIAFPMSIIKLERKITVACLESWETMEPF